MTTVIKLLRFCDTLEKTVGQVGLSKNTRLFCKGKYHCTAGLQFDWIGLDQTRSYVICFKSRPLFVYFRFFKHKFYRSTVGFSQIRTRIVRVGIRHACWLLDHHHGPEMLLLYARFVVLLRNPIKSNRSYVLLKYYTLIGYLKVVMWLLLNSLGTLSA